MVSDKRAIIHSRVSENPRQQWRGFVMYAELTGNREKQRIKSLCDNRLMWSLAQARTLSRRRTGRPLPASAAAAWGADTSSHGDTSSPPSRSTRANTRPSWRASCGDDPPRALFFGNDGEAHPFAIETIRAKHSPEERKRSYYGTDQKDAQGNGH